MEIKIPNLSLVVIIGVSSAGKSSFARKHFQKTEIVSSDECRAIIFDDYVINNQYQDLKRSIKYLKYEGFKRVCILRSPEKVDAVTEIVRV